VELFEDNVAAVTTC